MGVNDLSIDDEENLYRELQSWSNRRYVDERNAGLEFAKNVDFLSRTAGYGDPDLILSAAEGIRDGTLDQQSALQMIDSATEVEYQTKAQETEDKGPWPEWLKTASRWTFAGLELVPQLVTNFGTRAFTGLGGPGGPGPGQTRDPSEWYTPPTTESWTDGWFASTDFGAMLSGEETGNGFWIGEKALERQQQAVKAYRGMYDGEALTFGKGSAGIFFEPGSKPYNYMSGIIDAAAAIAVPSLPGAKVASKGATAAADVAGMRKLSGLTNFASPFVNTAKANSWLNTRSGTAVVERLARVRTVEEAMDILPKADNSLWDDILNNNFIEGTTDFRPDNDRINGMRRLLSNNLDEASSTVDELGQIRQYEGGLGVRRGLTDVRDIRVGAASDVRRGIAEKFRYERLGATVPGRELIIDIDNFDNPNVAGRLLTQTVKNARDYMKLVKVAPEQRDAVLRQLSRGLSSGNRELSKQAIDQLTDTVIDAMATRQGVFRKQDKEFLQKMFARYNEDMDGFKESGLFGDVIDGPGGPGVKTYDDLTAVINGQEVSGLAMKGDTAELYSEAKKFATHFPDPRNVRRASSRYAVIFAKAAEMPEVYGDAQGWVTATDFIVSKLFKATSLITGGYMTRNMIESGMRQLVAPGVKSGPAHPIEWVRAMSRRTFKGTIDGEEYAPYAARIAGDSMAEFDEATGVAALQAGLDPIEAEKWSYRNGQYSLASRGVNNQDYVRGVATEIRLLAGDQVARWAAAGLDVDEIVDLLKTTPEGQRYLARLNERWRGRQLTDAQGNSFRGDVVFSRTDVNGQIEFFDQNLRKFVSGVADRVERKTGGYTQLKKIIENAEIDGEFVNTAGATVKAFAGGSPGRRALNEFERFDYTEEFFDEIAYLMGQANTTLPQNVKYTKPLRLEAGAKGANVADRTVRHFFSHVFGKKEGFLNRSPVHRQYYYAKLEDLVDADQLSREAFQTAYDNILEASVKQAEDKVRLLKSSLKEPDKYTGKYEWNGAMVRKPEMEARLRRAERQLSDAQKRVQRGAQGEAVIVDPKKFDAWASRYVGSERMWNKIKQGRVSASVEGITAEQASFVAKAFALDQTQKVFFNAAERSNFTDIMRIAVPFGAAWKEAQTFNLKQIALNPNRLRKVQRPIRVAQDADPDNDGKGFFYEDPVTGNMTFNVPFGETALLFASTMAGGTLLQTATRGRGGVFAVGALGGLGAGAGIQQRVGQDLGDVGVDFTAPVQSLSQTLQVFPGFGPAVQYPAGALLRDKPQFKDVLAMVAPFGGYENPLDIVTPAWAEKFTQAIFADPKTDRWFAELYIDAGRALMATGEYDQTNPQDMERLMEKASGAAKGLLLLRSLGQFTGPYRPEPELTIPTDYEGTVTVGDMEILVENNVRTSVLAATWRQMQEDDYDNATENFMRAFGPDVLWFLPGLTETEVKGLAATDVFGEWEYENRDVTEQYPEVYGYFAPEGGEFDFQTYLRQLRTGERTRRSSIPELKAEAEAIVGRALYMDAIRMAEPVIDDGEREFLRRYREDLKKQYPGYGTLSIDINEQPGIMLQLEQMANDERMTGNPTAEALRVYFNQRNIAEQASINRDGFSSEPLSRSTAADMRQYLRSIANDLMVRYPEFGRVYSRVLFDEIDER